MDDIVLGLIIPTLAIVPAPLIQFALLFLARVHRPVIGICADLLVSLGSAVLGTAFLWLLQLHERQVLAYAAALVYGLLAFQGLLLALFRWAGLRKEQRTRR